MHAAPKRIFETADWVGLGPEKIEDQVRRLGDPDPTVRFWAATGLVAQGARAESGKAALRQALGDESVAVQTVAAEALCGLGECDKALSVLLKNLAHEQEYASLRAANALDRLDENARPVLSEMKAFAEPVASLQGRDFFREAAFPQWVLRAAIGELETGAKPGLAAVMR